MIDLAPLRRDAAGRRARTGWPDLPLRFGRVLAALADHGPMTAEQIRDATGMSFASAYQAACELRTRSLVTSTGNRGCRVYAITEAALARRQSPAATADEPPPGVELTPRLIAIAEVVAKRHGRNDTEIDDAWGAAQLAIVKAARCYDPAKGMSPESWLFMWAEGYVKNNRVAGKRSKRHRTTVSLDAPLSAAPDAGTLADAIASPTAGPPERSVELADWADRVLRRRPRLLGVWVHSSGDRS